MPRDLNAAIAAAVNQSPGARVSIGPGVTWGALPPKGFFPSLVAQGDAQAVMFHVSEVSETGTPAVKVGKGASKPVGAQVASVPRQIDKYAALANLTLEDFEQSEAVIAAVVNTLLSQCYVAQDADAVAALDAAAAEPVASSSWVGAISAGQAQVAAKGGSPNLVVVPAASWASLAAEVATTPGLVSPSGEAIMSVLGSAVVISPKAPAGEAFVVDPAACLTVLRDVGVIVASGYDDTNAIRVIVDLFASTYVTRPSGVAAISVSGTGTTRGGSGSKRDYALAT